MVAATLTHARVGASFAIVSPSPRLPVSPSPRLPVSPKRAAMESQSLLHSKAGGVQQPPAYAAPTNGFCSIEIMNGPYPNSEDTWYRYGNHGGAWNNLSELHNKGCVLASECRDCARTGIGPHPHSWLVAWACATACCAGPDCAWAAVLASEDSGRGGGEGARGTALHTHFFRFAKWPFVAIRLFARVLSVGGGPVRRTPSGLAR